MKICHGICRLILRGVDNSLEGLICLIWIHGACQQPLHRLDTGSKGPLGGIADIEFAVSKLIFQSCHAISNGWYPWIEGNDAVAIGNEPLALLGKHDFQHLQCRLQPFRLVFQILVKGHMKGRGHVNKALITGLGEIWHSHQLGIHLLMALPQVHRRTVEHGSLARYKQVHGSIGMINQIRLSKMRILQQPVCFLKNLQPHIVVKVNIPSGTFRPASPSNAIQAGKLPDASCLHHFMAGPVLCQVQGIGLDAIVGKDLTGMDILLIILWQLQTVLVK